MSHEKVKGVEEWFLFHAPCSRKDFEIPKGPAFFYLKEGKGEKYVKLYHLHDLALGGKSREKGYEIKEGLTPNIVHTETVSGEQLWVEKHSDLKLPLVLRGRGSIIDRWPQYTQQIVKVYEDNGIDGLFDEYHDTIAIFRPEKFLVYMGSQEFIDETLFQ